MEPAPPDIYPELEKVRPLLAAGDWSGVERAGQQLCQQHAPHLAGPIAKVPVAKYEKALRASLLEAFQRATPEVVAIYWEYDLDNDWSSAFFLCGEYRPLSAGDDDWAADWLDDFNGPDFQPFARLYQAEFDRTPEALASTVYLVARTMAALGRAAEGLKLGKRALCAAFHDQDGIMRLSEGSAPAAAVKPPHPAPKRIALDPEAKERLDYVLNHYRHLANEAEEAALRGGGPSKDPAVNALRARGWPAFGLEIAARIERDNPGTVVLNLCPKCSKLCRTPQARQCRHCSASWHTSS